MDEFLAQATQNKEFLSCIEDHFPDQFFDWKITVQFYIAIHLIKSLAKLRNAHIGDTHHDIANSLNPKRSGKQVFPFPGWAWSKYSTLFQYSRSSRYDGITDRAIVLSAQKKNYTEGKEMLKALCSYMKSQGIEL